MCGKYYNGIKHPFSQEPVQHVHKNGIHAEYNKRKAPFRETPNLDKPVKQEKKECYNAACEKGIGTGKHSLDDGNHRVERQAEDNS